MKTINISLLNSITSKQVLGVDLSYVSNLIKNGDPKFLGNSFEDTRQKVYALKKQQKLPVMAFSVLCEGGHSKTKIKKYTNLFCGDIDNLKSEEEAISIKKLISSNSCVALCFISPSGKGVKFVLRLKTMPRPENILKNENDENRFTKLDNYHKAWFTIISNDIKEKYNIELDTQCSNVNRLCYISYDPEVYFNPNAKEYEFEGKFKDIFPIYLNLCPKNPNEMGHRNTLFYTLSCKAKEEGIDEELVKEFGIKYFTLSSNEIENTIISSDNANIEKKKKNKTIVRNEDILNLFNNEFDLRNNIVKNCFEIKRKSQQKWEQLEEIQENTIFKHITDTYPLLNKSRIIQLIKTTDVEQYDNLVNYFLTLPTWDNHNYIKDIAKTIKTKKTRLFENDFKKWLVGVVATVIEPKVVNNFCLVLAGKEGTGKSSWFENIVPPQLREDHYQDNRIDLHNKDLFFKLAQNLLIVLDEFDQYSKKDIPEIKSIITSKNIQERFPYAKYQKKYIRRCSFAATINKTNFLCGEEGERRFLVHEALSINYQFPIDHAQLYAQAYYLYKSGFKYWEAGKEIQKRKEINKEYRESNITEELFFKYYKKPTQEQIDNKSLSLRYLTVTDIKVKLCQTWGVNSNEISINNIGRLLIEHDFIKKVKKGIRRYIVIEKSDIEIREDQDYFIEGKNEDKKE